MKRLLPIAIIAMFAAMTFSTSCKKKSTTSTCSCTWKGSSTGADTTWKFTTAPSGTSLGTYCNTIQTELQIVDPSAKCSL